MQLSILYAMVEGLTFENFHGRSGVFVFVTGATVVASFTFQLVCHYMYGVASVCRLDKIIGLFCKRAL